MDYGSHIGEYIREKIQSSGRSFKWVADKLHTSRQNFTESWLGKPELKPSQIASIEKVLGQDFFDEFFENNRNLKRYQVVSDDQSSGLNQASDHGPQYLTSGTGYSIKLEIDPGRFNPALLQPLTDSLRRAIEEFQARTGQ